MKKEITRVILDAFSQHKPAEHFDMFGEDPPMASAEEMWLDSARYWVGRSMQFKWSLHDLRVGIDGAPEVKDFFDLVALLRQSENPEDKKLIIAYDKSEIQTQR